MSSAYTSLILGDGPIAYFHCDEDTSEASPYHVHDASGNGHDLRLFVFPPFGGPIVDPRQQPPLVDAEPGGYSLFVDIPPGGGTTTSWAESASLDTWQQLTGDFTIEAWLKNADPSITYARDTKMVIGTQDFYIGVHVAFTPAFLGDSVLEWCGGLYLDADFPTLHRVGAGERIQPATPYYVAVTRESNILSVYVNCELKGTLDVGTGVAKNRGSKFYFGSDDFFDNSPNWVDEVALYNYALTHTQLCKRVRRSFMRSQVVWLG